MNELDSSEPEFRWTAYKLTALRWAVLSAALAAIVMIFTPNRYRSEVRILPGDTKGSLNVGGMAGAAAAFGIALPSSGGPEASYVDILKSRWVSEALLQTQYVFPKKSWRFGVPKQTRESLLEYLKVQSLDRGLTLIGSVIYIQKDLKSNLLMITAETQSPELSMQIAKRATELLEDFVRNRTQTRGGNKARFATQRLAEAKQDYQLAEQKFTIFLFNNRNYQSSGDPSVRLLGIRLEAELGLHRQMVTTLSLSREQALMEEKDDTLILNVLDAGSVATEKSGPSRAPVVVLAFLLGGLLRFFVANQGWIRRRLYTSAGA